LIDVRLSAHRGAAPVRRRRTDDGRWALALLALPLMGLGVFYVWPLVRTVALSFSDGTPFRGYHLSGIGHWVEALSGGELGRALLNTLMYAAIVLLGVPLAMIIAAMLHQRGLRFRSGYRVFYFLPVVTMPVAVAMVWRYIYNGDFGLLNAILQPLGLPATAWVADPKTALVAVAIVGIWMSLGTNIVILAAGMEAIPEEVTEAAMMDGAGPIRRFISVTAPLLSPSVFLVCVLSVISSLQVFDVIFVMLGRMNPALGSVKSIVYLFYEAAFVRNDRPTGAVIALITLVVTALLTFIQFRLQNRWVHYA